MGPNERKLGILVVGTGFLGAARAAAAEVARGVRLAAVFDREPARAQATAARHRVLAAPDLESGLALPGVDAVVVATPHADHTDAVRAALEAGKHVLCEKPLAVNPADARELARLADSRKLRLATGLNHRFYPPVADALSLATSGAIGRIEGVRAEIGHRASTEFLAGWHGDPARSGGGTLMDNGPHACDLVRRLMVEVVSAQGCLRQSASAPKDCELEAFALFRSHDRAVAELRSSWALEEGYLSLNIRGDAGHLRVETAPWRLTGVLATGKRLQRNYLAERTTERLFRLWAGCERSLVRELEDFADLSPSRPRIGASGWDGCRVAEMVEAVYRSAAERREIGLDPLPVRLPGERRRVGEPMPEPRGGH